MRLYVSQNVSAVTLTTFENPIWISDIEPDQIASETLSSSVKPRRRITLGAHQVHAVIDCGI
jgi:hypothetical protein